MIVQIGCIKVPVKSVVMDENVSVRKNEKLLIWFSYVTFLMKWEYLFRIFS